MSKKERKLSFERFRRLKKLKESKNGKKFGGFWEIWANWGELMGLAKKIWQIGPKQSEFRMTWV
jgi:hypothetical protein